MSRTQCWTEQLAATLHAHLYSPTVQRRRTAKDYVETGWSIFLVYLHRIVYVLYTFGKL